MISNLSQISETVRTRVISYNNIHGETTVLFVSVHQEQGHDDLSFLLLSTPSAGIKFCDDIHVGKDKYSTMSSGRSGVLA